MEVLSWWKERTRKEEEWHDEEVHDELKTLHIVKERSDHRTEGGKEQRDKKHKEDRDGDERPAIRAEAENGHEDEHEYSLHGGDGGTAERAADHDVQAVYGRDQRLFKETELAIPDDLDAREDGGEDDAHADDARRKIIKIVIQYFGQWYTISAISFIRHLTRHMRAG